MGDQHWWLDGGLAFICYDEQKMGAANVLLEYLEIMLKLREMLIESNHDAISAWLLGQGKHVILRIPDTC